MKKTDAQTTESNQEAVEMVDVDTQTENLKSADVSIQVDLLQPSVNETGVQTNTAEVFPVTSGLAATSSVTDNFANDNHFFCVKGMMMKNIFPLVVK